MKPRKANETADETNFLKDPFGGKSKRSKHGMKPRVGRKLAYRPIDDDLGSSLQE